MSASVVRFDSYKTLPAASIGATFTAVGTPIAHNWRIICFTNNTNADVIFSADSTNLNFYLPAGSFKLFDLSTNREDTATTWLISLNTQIYAMHASGAPTTGSVYVEGLYGQGQ